MNRIEVPTNLLQFQLPGLEQAANAVIDQMNGVCKVLGMPEYRLVRNSKKEEIEFKELPLLAAELDRRAIAQNKRRAKERAERNGKEEWPKYIPGGRRILTDEHKGAIVRAFDAHGVLGRIEWMKEHGFTYGNIQAWRKGENKQNRKAKAAVAAAKQNGTGKGASVDDMIAWARQHDNVFKLDDFKAKYPHLHLRGLGRVVVTGKFRKINRLQYELIA